MSNYLNKIVIKCFLGQSAEKLKPIKQEMKNCGTKMW